MTQEEKNRITSEIRKERMKDEPDGNKIETLKYLLDNRKINTDIITTYFRENGAIANVKQISTVIKCQSFEEYQKNGFIRDIEKVIF